MKKLKLCLLGLGNCGQAFTKILVDKHAEIEKKYNTDVIISAISTRSKGTVICENGIDIEKALSDIEENGRFVSFELSPMDSQELAKVAEYDVLIEMTPLNIFTGEPATTHLMTAFERGKHAITANKGPIAWHYRKLKKLAEEKGVGFFYETTVMDGTPVFNLTEHTLKMAKVTEVSGILNSTTNFILEEMEKGCEYEDIMRRGTEMGFIEADPSMDIEGYDAAAKITALLNVLMDADMTPDRVERKGIEDITVEDIRDAAERGCRIKLICSGRFDENGNVKASVRPVEVPCSDMLSSIDSTTSVVSITTDLMGKISVVEHNPEIEQTGYGVFSDLIRVLDITAE